MRRPPFFAAFATMALIVAALVLRDRVPDEIVTGAARALDGDSIVVGGREMRLKGLDAPEAHQTCTVSGREVACGRLATLALRRWLERGPVTCLGSETDRYHRLLVTCRINGQDIGADLVRSGVAVDYGGYPAEEREAAADRRGVWAGTFERPEAYRRRMRGEGHGNGRSPRKAAGPP